MGLQGAHGGASVGDSVVSLSDLTPHAVSVRLHFGQMETTTPSGKRA